MRPIGIAVTTYNRRALLMAQIDAIRARTTTPYTLLVCDDGSSDGTVDACRDVGVAVITGPNRGVAWNKNRGIWHLINNSDCDPILLLDDDVVPLEPGWEDVWRRAAARLGHANAALYVTSLIGGDCTPQEPGLARQIGGHTIVFSRSVLSFVGYMDVRFGQYGHEHTELSMRAIRLGYGGLFRAGGLREYLFQVVHSPITLASAPSSVDPTTLADNAPLLHALHNQPIYRLPWRTEEQMLAFRAEQLAPEHMRPMETIPEDFDRVAYLDRYPDVASAGFDPVYHYLRHGRAEGRAYRR